MNKLKSLLVLFLLFGSILLVIVPTPVSAVETPKTVNSYWRLVTITDPINGYPVLINITKDVGGTMNCANHCKDDFSDLRFFNHDNVTKLDYWIENYTSGKYAWVWVELPANATTVPKMIMYYGNASANPDSDGEQTFFWFDDYSVDSSASYHKSLTAAGALVQYECVNISTLYTLTATLGGRMRYNAEITYWNAGGDVRYVASFIGANANADEVLEGMFYPYNGTNPPGADDHNVTFELWSRKDGSPPQQTALKFNWTHTYKEPVTYQLNWTTAGSAFKAYHFPTVAANWTIVGLTANIPPKTNLERNASWVMRTSDHIFRPGNKTAGYLDMYSNGTVGNEAVRVLVDWAFVDQMNKTEPTLALPGAEQSLIVKPITFRNLYITNNESSWYFSEHVRNQALDESWYENTTDWHTYNRTTEFWGLNAYCVNNTGIPGINLSMINISGMDRFGAIMNIHNTGAHGSDITQGYLIGNMSDRCYYIGAGEGLIFWLYYDASTGFWYDVVNESLGRNSRVHIDLELSQSNITNWYGNDSLIKNTGYTWGSIPGTPIPYDWEIAPSYANGSWLKLIYDANCDCLQFKCWGDPSYKGLMQEPLGWVIDNYDWPGGTLLDEDPVSIGIAMWNPDGDTIRGDFDIIDVFQENYSYNSSFQSAEYSNRQPFMTFPQNNAEDIETNLDKFMNDAETGNLTSNSVTDFVRSILNNATENSRPANLSLSAIHYNQNDTIRYFSFTLYNCLGLTPAWAYDNYLVLMIDDALNGNITGSHEDGDAMVAINVDGDTTWDDNDRAYYISTDGTQWEWHGTTFSPWSISANAFYTNRQAFQNVYRYWNHSLYIFAIPLAHLIKDDLTNLNAYDNFNLSIFTFIPSSSRAYFWQNYNETICTARHSEVLSTIKQYYLNEAYLAEDDLDILPANILRWGVGQITGGKNPADEFAYDTITTKTANRTTVPGDNLWALLTYTVNITNNGTGALTNVYFNDTWYDCDGYPYDWTLVSCTHHSPDNITWNNASRIWSIREGFIAPGDTWSFTYSINVTNCSATNLSGTMWNNYTVNATGITNAETGGESVRFGTLVNQVCVWYTTDLNTNLPDIGNSVLSILGIVIIIGAIMSIVGLVMVYTKRQ